MDTKTTLLLKRAEVAEELRISRAQRYDADRARRTSRRCWRDPAGASRWTRCARGS